MPKYDLRYESKIEKCTYCWDEVNEYWVTICRADHLPEDVTEQLQNDSERAVLVEKAKKRIQGAKVI